MEPEGSQPCLQEIATGFCHELNASSPRLPILFP